MGICSAVPGTVRDLFYEAYKEEKGLGRAKSLQVNKIRMDFIGGWQNSLRI
jgi:hypothetical protein